VKFTVSAENINQFKLSFMDHRSSEEQELEALNHKSELHKDHSHPSNPASANFVSLLKVAAVFFFAFMLYKMTERVYSVS
jgi:hypothetical protein